MWKCPACGRSFARTGQSHTCRRVDLEQHFARKDLAREIFNALVARINAVIGPCTVLSIPCCIHLVGRYDFLAALPRRTGLEIRFILHRALKGPRIKAAAWSSKTACTNCVQLDSVRGIDAELIGWLGEAYHLRDA